MKNIFYKDVESSEYVNLLSVFTLHLIWPKYHVSSNLRCRFFFNIVTSLKSRYVLKSFQPGSSCDIVVISCPCESKQAERVLGLESPREIEEHAFKKCCITNMQCHTAQFMQKNRNIDNLGSKHH